MEESFVTEVKWTVAYSLFIHIAFIGLIVIVQKFSKKNLITIPSYTIVDLVNLPVKKKEALPKKRKKKVAVRKKKILKKKRIVKKKPKKIKKPVFTPKPIEKDNEDEFLKKLEELEKKWVDEDQRLLEDQKQVKEEREVEDAKLSERIKALKAKWAEEERELGVRRKIALSEYNNSIRLDSPNFPVEYLKIIQESINENWKLPIKQPTYTGTRVVIISFKILRRGGIANAAIEKSSGISALDTAAMQAVIDASPLPAPLPDEFTENYLGVHFKFEYSYFDG